MWSWRSKLSHCTEIGQLIRSLSRLKPPSPGKILSLRILKPQSLSWEIGSSNSPPTPSMWVWFSQASSAQTPAEEALDFLTPPLNLYCTNSTPPTILSPTSNSSNIATSTETALPNQPLLQLPLYQTKPSQSTSPSPRSSSDSTTTPTWLFS